MEKEQRSGNCFVRLLVKYPVAIFFVALLVQIALARQGAQTLGLTLTFSGRNAYGINDDILTQQLDSWDFAQREISIAAQQSSQQSVVRASHNFIVIYSSTNGQNLCEPGTLKRIQALETKLAASSKWPTACYRGSGQQSCQPAVSVVSKFFDFEGVLQNTTAVLAELSSPEQLSLANPQGSHFFFGKTFNAQNQVCLQLRSLFRVGLPVAGYKSVDDRVKEQEKVLDDASLELKKIIDLESQAWKDSGIDLLYQGSVQVFQEIAMNTMMSDGMLAFGTMVFIFLFVWYHTESVFLASVGIFQIVCSFPIAGFWCVNALQIRYFDVMNIFLIFIILGIGADDIFVFVDAWKQSGHMRFSDLESRMDYVFRRASKAMLVTSATTAVAFGVNGGSKLMPIAAFGLFAALLIVSNYLAVITFFPAALIFWHKHMSHRPAICCICCYRKKPENRDQQNSQTEKSETSAEEQNAKDPPQTDSPAENSGENFQTDSRITKFLVEKYHPFLQKFKIPLVLFLVAVVATFVSLGTQLIPDEAGPQMFPDDHFITKLQNIGGDFYSSSEDKLVELHVVFGVGQVPDRQDFNQFDFGTDGCNGGACGTYKLDPDFTFNSTADQMWLLNFCESVATKFDTSPCTRKENPGKCFVSDFKAWRLARNESFPVESGLGDALAQFFASPPAFSNFIAPKLVRFDTKTKQISFFALAWDLNFKFGIFYKDDQTSPCHSWWSNAVSQANAPSNLKGYVTTAPIAPLFVNAQIQDQFTLSAIQGMLVSLAISLVVLLISTMNWIIALQAFFCVASVVGSAMGMMYIAGWKIGAIEAVCLTLSVGFSVDYVVHFAHSYQEAAEFFAIREQRVKRALFEMGISIIGGSATTFGGSLFLFGTQVMLFSRFGTFVCITISFSFIYAFVLFLGIMSIIGPQNTTGNINFCCKKAATSAVGAKPVEAVEGAELAPLKATEQTA